MNGLRPFLGSKDRVIRNRWQIRAFLADRATFPDMRKIAALFSLPFFLGVACGGSSATAPASSATASPPAASPAAGAPSKAVAAAPAKVGHAPKAPIPLDEYFKIRRVSSRSGILLTFSHDEKLVAYLSDEGGRTDVWVQPVAGGAGTQITHVKGFVQGLAFSPTADVLAFTTDTGGDELPHLFLTDGAGNSPKDLTADMAPGRRADFVE